MEIERYLLDNGIKPHYRGFNQLAYAIELCQKNKKYMEGFTKWLYPDVAKDLKTTKTRVERDIRIALRCSGKNETISEFICKSILELKLLKKEK